MKNLVILIGRVTRPLEIKESKTKTKYVHLTLAVKRDKEHTDFIDCTAFNKHAEILTQYTQKGDLLYCEGTLSVNVYEKDGIKQTRTNVILKETVFLTSHKKEDNKLPDFDKYNEKIN